jgi:catechol 2,3-dioxygenase-like lactoylglutathione lyase family enzyme
VTAPTLRVTSVTIAAPEPRALALFYAELLGCPLGRVEQPGPGDPPEAGWAQLRQGVDGITLNFEYEPHYRPPRWPSVVGEQQTMEHLDIWVQDLASATEWALLAGARLATVQPQDRVRVLLDPAGHPFCLFAD